MINKKGAMFGLDARIALAIFGALSVISGAALYSAIQEARVVSYLTSLKEVEKALEQYYLDNAVLPPVDSVNALEANVLISNSENLNTWKGPYLNSKTSSRSYCIDNVYGTEGALMTCLYMCEDGAGSTCTQCTDLSDANCRLYIESYTLNRNLLDRVDEKIDGVKDSSNGNARVRDHGTGLDGTISLRYLLPKY
jgi:type II secretory pathway pseudopilin PulG